MSCSLPRDTDGDVGDRGEILEAEERNEERKGDKHTHTWEVYCCVVWRGAPQPP